MAALTNNDVTLIQMMKSLGYVQCVKIAKTMQGSIWKTFEKSTNKAVVVKFADINHLENHTSTLNNRTIRVQENIQKEAQILEYLSKGQCPKYIPKYLSSGQSNQHFFLQMTNGGGSLFDFVVSVHHLIDEGHINIAEWHKFSKIIFKQMIECIEYIHSKNVCHFDISLENFLINDIIVCHNHQNKIKFCIDNDDSVQIKLCDFGLTEIFSSLSFQSNKYCGKLNYQSPEILSRKQSFSAKSNDIWCLGVCLFMMIIGTAPWDRASNRDQRFNIIMNGGIMPLLSS